MNLDVECGLGYKAFCDHDVVVYSSLGFLLDMMGVFR
jgi:hypothetical protein